MTKRISIHPLGLPLGWQLFGIIIGALVVAQLVTLLLTILLPPAAPQTWDLKTVAASLLGREDDPKLERKMLSGPPDIAGGGWLVSESSREALARQLGQPTGNVVLAFYTQLPVGGVSMPADQPRRPLELSGLDAGEGWLKSVLVPSAAAQAAPRIPPPGGPPGGAPGGIPGGGFPGGGVPGGGMPGGGIPGGGFPGGAPPAGPSHAGGMPGGGPPSGPPSGATGPGSSAPSAPPQGAVAAPHAPGAPQTAAPAPPSAARSAPGGPPMQGPAGPLQGTPAGLPQTLPGGALTPSGAQARGQLSTGPQGARATAQNDLRVAQSVKTPETSASPTTTTAVASDATSRQGNQTGSGQAAAATPSTAKGAAVTIPFRQQRTFLSFTTPPFIEGDFIAAMRLDDGNWVAVAPRAEPFPNQWQTRVLLWFVLSLLLVGPFIWFFARRIVQPLEQFAGTAETLGRNPGASVVPLAGPAEIGRAARAFNQMQSRLRAFVDDRTMMVGAISHDLRTPLTRMRFRLEDVPDSQRDGLLGEVEEMEEMITQVIGFIRDVSAAGPRETVDLATLVEETVRDARVVGAEIEINRLEDAVIDGDFASLRRVLANLLDNAMKYGSHVRVHVSRKGGEASATVIDDGPGITKEEMEQVFDPFYRCEEARASGKPGSGLGLSVCRSIARAHGGDVVLSNTDEGFKATLTLPVAYDAPLGRAA